MILLLTTIFFIILTAVITYIYYRKTDNRHKKRLNTAVQFIDEYGNIPKCVRQSYMIICQRRYEHIMTFFNFQLINKVFGFLSVVFSILSLISYILESIDIDIATKGIANSLANILVSFLSIICVIIVLYASPNRLVVDYINAWRVDEQVINEITANLEEILDKDITEQSNIMKDYLQKLSTAEESIKSDED